MHHEIRMTHQRPRSIPQDERTSAHFGARRFAIRTGAVDAVVPVHEIGPALVRLVRARPRAATLAVPEQPYGTQ